MRRRGGFGSGRLIVAAVMVLGALISYYASRQVNPITGRKQAIALSPKQEVALGMRSAPRMTQQFGGEDADPAMRRETLAWVGAKWGTSSANTRRSPMSSPAS